MTFKCEFCNRTYARESTLMVHVCEQKRRHLAQHDKHVVIGHHAFNMFWKISQRATAQKSFEDFRKSTYYSSFVKFGSFVSNVNPLYPEKFIEWLIRQQIPLDKWDTDAIYEKYVSHLLQSESVETALERSIMHMVKWGEAHNEPWEDYFRKVSPNRATYDIKDGKISPWLLLLSPSGKKLLTELDDKQLGYVELIVNPPYWVSKFKKQSNDTELVKQVIKEAGI